MLPFFPPFTRGFLLLRYFILSDLSLFYYKNEDPATAIGFIWLEGAECMAQTEGEENVFQIITSSGRLFSFRTETARERDEWVEEIRKVALVCGSEGLRVLQTELTLTKFAFLFFFPFFSSFSLHFIVKKARTGRTSIPREQKRDEDVR